MTFKIGDTVRRLHTSADRLILAGHVDKVFSIGPGHLIQLESYGHQQDFSSDNFELVENSTPIPLNNVERYTEFFYGVAKDEDGEYVKYSDYKKLWYAYTTHRITE